MGRAQIVSGGPDGRYTIRVDVGESRRDQLVIAAQQNVDQVTAALVTAEARYADYQAETEALRVVAEVDVQAYVDAIAAHGPTSMQAGEAFLKVLKSGSALEGSRSKEFPERANRDHLRIMLKEAQARLSRWQSLVLSDTRQAWCADLTESAVGTVATIEVNGESDLILLKPGAPAPTAADGALLSRELLSPEQAFFNAGILPGWQKYKPTFRRGTLTAINRDNHTCSVTLAAASSSAQRLDVNQGTSLSNVPVTYMTCHSAVFEVGDQVVVSFDGQSWESPRVIGFVTDPRRCISYSLYWSRAVSDFRELFIDDAQIVFDAILAASDAAYHSSTVAAINSGAASARWRVNRGPWQSMTRELWSADKYAFVGYGLIGVTEHFWIVPDLPAFGSIGLGLPTFLLSAWAGNANAFGVAFDSTIEAQIIHNGSVKFVFAFKPTVNNPTEYASTGGLDDYALTNGQFTYRNDNTALNYDVFGSYSRMEYALSLSAD